MNEESKLIVDDAIKRGILKDTPEGYVLLNSGQFSPSHNLTLDKPIIFPYSLRYMNLFANCKLVTYEGHGDFWIFGQKEPSQEKIKNG